jgi:hypothetical protein
VTCPDFGIHTLHNVMTKEKVSDTLKTYRDITGTLPGHYRDKKRDKRDKFAVTCPDFGIHTLHNVMTIDEVSDTFETKLSEVSEKSVGMCCGRRQHYQKFRNVDIRQGTG